MPGDPLEQLGDLVRLRLALGHRAACQSEPRAGRVTYVATSTKGPSEGGPAVVGLVLSNGYRSNAQAASAGLAQIFMSA